MSKIIFLLEEPSMKNVLQHILPEVIPKTVQYQMVAHEGKSRLRKSIPTKLRGWQEPNVYFVVMEDQDSSDCIASKQRLVDLATCAGRPDTLVRIVCRELEAWFFGDFDAIEKAYGIDLTKVKSKNKYRNPDDITDAKEELQKIIQYQPLSGADRIAQHMSVERNCSKSFNVFIQGIKRLCESIS